MWQHRLWLGKGVAEHDGGSRPLHGGQPAGLGWQHHLHLDGAHAFQALNGLANLRAKVLFCQYLPVFSKDFLFQGHGLVDGNSWECMAFGCF